MKTHLPVALRKALIAALVAVSVSEYNQAQAAMNLNMDAAAVSNVCEVNTLDVELTGSLAGGNHQITSTTGNLDINTDSDLDGDYEIEGVGNSFKTESGYIKAGSVEGNETRFETVSGDIITGDIISDGNSFKTESGFIETGDITGNNTTLEVTGEGAISTGEITGSGTRIQAEHSTLENISNMEGVTMTVGGIEATAADTNATLKATEITSTGNVTIGADDAGAEETDTLTLTENSSITATGTDDGAGNVTHATMKIDQNVALAGGSSLSTTGGDVTVTGHVAVSDAGTISSDKASVSIGSLGDVSDNLKISAGKDVAIGEIANTPEAPPMKSYTDAVADLQVTAGGAVQIGDSAGSLLDASIEAQGAITIGQTAASSMLLEVHDSTTGQSLISTQDDLTVNQSIRIDSTGGDRVVIKAAGGMSFKGENTHMHGDSTSVIDVESVESIVFSSLQGTDIGTGVIVKTTGEDSDISVHSGDVSVNPVAGKMYALKGAVRIDGGTNQIMSDVDTPTLQAQDGIEVTARKENTLDNALLQTVAGGIELESDLASGINMVYDSALSVTREGNITISGHENYLKTATGETVDGKIMLTAGALNKIDVGTRLEATQEVEIAAGTNNLIRGATVVKSKQAGIDITAATGGNQITGAGTKVAASGTVTIGAATNNLIESGATVLSDTDNIGISADGGNQITGTDTRVEAEQAVKIEAGTNNLIGDAAVVKSKQAGIDMTAATGGNQITGAGTKVAASGAVTIGAAANNLVDAGATVLSDTDNIIISAAGGNFVQNAATVNAGGTGYIYLNGGTTATNVVRHAGTELTAGGNIDMSGAQNIISNSATLDSGKNVNLVAAERNYVDKATILADGMIGALGVTNVVNQESQVRATAGITIHSTGSSADDGNLITGGSSVVSETDKVHILAGMSNEISGTDTRVEAQQAVKIEAGTNNLISDAAVVKSKLAGIDMTAATGGNQITGAGTKVAASGAVTIGAATDNLVEAGATVLSDTENISISADGGNQITGTDTRVEAEQAVTIEAGTSNLISDAAVVKSKQAGIDMTAATGGNQITGAGTKVAASGAVTIGAAANNLVDAGATVLSDTDNIIISAAGGNFVQNAATVNAGGTGYIYLNGGTTATNVVRHAGTELTAGGNVDMSGAQNIISNSATLDSGKNVNLVAADADAAKVAQNIVDAAEVLAAGSVALKGEANVVSNGAALKAESGSVNMVAENTADSTVAVNKLVGSEVSADGAVTLLAGGSNVVDSSAIDTTSGNIIINAPGSNFVQNAATVNAGGTGYIYLNGGTTATNVVRHAGTELTAGGNIDMSGAQNIISNSATLDSGKNVNLVAAERNYVDKATILADGMIGALGVTNVVNQESQVRATAGITIHSTGSSADDGNLITGGSSVVSETDKVHILAGMSNEIFGADTRVDAAREVKIEAGANNLIRGASVVKSKQAGIDITAATGGNQITGAGTKVAASGAVTIGAATDNLVEVGATVLSDTENISISADGGNQITGTDTRVEAQQAVKIEAGTSNLISDAAVVKSKQAGIDMTAATGGNQIAGAGTKVAASGPVTISAATNNTVSDGACVRAENAGVGITGEAVNTVDGSEVKAQGGALTMGNENLTTDTVENRIRNAAAVTASENVELTGDANAISGASSVEAGLHVTMTADTQNAVVDSTVTAKAGNITLSDVGSSVASLQNVVTSSAGETTTLTAGGNVTIAGENIITGTDPGATRITAENGSISIHDDNYIRNVALEAQGAEGDVSIITGAGKATWIEDSSISGETVLIAGDVADGRSDDKLAVVTGDAMEIISRGEDDGAGITLNNVSVQDTVRNEQNIMAKNDGNIILRNRVDLENGTLSIENAGTSTGRISVDGDTVLNMKAASTLNGRLTGAGIINKSGGDELLLNYDHTSFNGTIYANGSHSGNPADGSVADSANPGSWITISGAGVGSGASIVLKNTDLVITAPGAQIGTLDTTWDEAGVNNEHLTGGTLISDGSSSDGSYTKDGNSRADFTTVGSVLEVNMAATGDVVAASDMNLSDATLIKLNAAIAEDGSASSDVIHASGTINAAARTGLNSTSTATAPSTARVYVMHNDAAATAAEGARTTIMQGTMATDINEDVLYDVAESGNGTYQRILQERNVHLENGGNHVDLVYSKNYRSASKTPQMQQVANALREISDTFHHSEGTLAASPNRLHNLIDAFDYTRSEGAAQRGLQSVAGTGNVLPRLMMFDSSRRHLENLRGQMLMPVCADANGMGGVVRRNNVWMTYTSSHDELCGDAYLEDYSRSANGAMLGIDRSVNCKLRVGLSLGYEESTGKSGSSRIEADTFFVDAYAAGVTGRFKHRASVGLATSSFDTNRNVLVEAGYHTFVGTGKGSVDSLSLNFGYEISTDYKLSETATLTPYAALNLSWHKLDTMREKGMGEAGLVTAYDNEWQSEIILGASYNRLFTVLRNLAPALFYADAAMHLELFNDRVSVKNRFLGASASWRAESMNRQPLYFELGVGVAVPLSPGWTATAGAAYEIGPDRAGVSGNVGVRYSF